jgi:hypothetical protein
MSEIEITEGPAIFRGMLRDIVACDDYPEVCRKLGLVPAGPDVDSIEHYKSHERIDEFNKVADEAFPHAEIAADLLYRLVRLGNPEAVDDDCERVMFTVVSRTAVATVNSHLLEKGTLGVLR